MEQNTYENNNSIPCFNNKYLIVFNSVYNIINNSIQYSIHTNHINTYICMVTWAQNITIKSIQKYTPSYVGNLKKVFMCFVGRPLLKLPITKKHFGPIAAERGVFLFLDRIEGV